MAPGYSWNIDIIQDRIEQEDACWKAAMPRGSFQQFASRREWRRSFRGVQRKAARKVGIGICIDCQHPEVPVRERTRQCSGESGFSNAALAGNSDFQRGGA